MSKQVKVYVSHCIRGRKGLKATNADMKRNNDLAIIFGKALRRKWPGTNFYVPGDHDEFIIIAFRDKYLTEKQILDVDCKIVSTCNFILAYSPDGYLSRGMKVEIEHANEAGIPVIVVASLGATGINLIQRQLLSFMR